MNMRYTAIALAIMGVLIAGFAGSMYLGITGPASGEGDPDRTLLGLLLGLAVAAMLAGGVMLAFGGKGYDESHGTFWRRRAKAAADARATAAHEHSKP
jgi:hypothetical protein